MSPGEKQSERRIEMNKLHCKKYGQRKRMEAIAALGGKCSRCGIDDWRVLQIDHITGGGNRKLIRTICRSKYHGVVVAEAQSGTYQLLCANCNWIKRYELRETGNYAVRPGGLDKRKK